MEKSVNGLYEFGRFRLDRAERLLLRDGERIPLTPKAFDLLVALVEGAGHLLEREALLKQIWPDSFVEENNLADNISRLRKTLGEGDNGEKFIETVPKRGYRFVAEVRRADGGSLATISSLPVVAPGSGERRRRSLRFWLLSGALALTSLLAVAAWLNFRVNQKAEVEQLEFKGNFYLGKWNQGEVRRGIEYYTRAASLNPNSSTAYEGMATGWNFLSDVHLPPREAMPKAKAAAIKALHLNEKSAHAHVAMALIKAQYDWDWDGARSEFNRALELDPGANSIHQVYGYYLIAAGRHADAQAEMRRVVDADANDDYGLWGLGMAFYFGGQYEQAVEQFRRAIALESGSHWSHMLLGWAYERQGKFADAITELEQASRLFDGNPQIRAAIGHAYAASGQRAAAQNVLLELSETAKRRYVSAYDIATIHAGLGETDLALKWLEQASVERSGWLAWWLKSDPKFDALRVDPRFHDLLKRVGLERQGL